MCGIAGIFDLDRPAPPDARLIHRMSDAIAHRGPDGEGHHLEPGVALGHRRLAIIDVAGGAQPIFNEDGAVSLVYNGEIYNYLELADELLAAGHVFRTRSDTEVVVHAWEQWGEACVKRFRGMFAFALHDRRQDMLFLARDRLGKKPLYYGMAGGQLLFASELKALLVDPRIQRRIDPCAVEDYFALGYVPDPGTIYRDVHKLPAGHTLAVRRGKPLPAPQSYWQPRMDIVPQEEAEAVHQLQQRLSEAVRIRLMSEVPLGAFLSGGVDSSGIVALMAAASQTPVKTFCIGFDRQEEELGYAQAVADRYGTEHHVERASTDPLSEYAGLAAIFDEPFADSSAAPSLKVARMARRNVTVALTGDAGDELFAGYRRYRMYANVERWRGALPEAVRRGVFGALGRVYPKLDFAPKWLRAKYTFQELAENSAYGYYRTVCKFQDGLRHGIFSAAMRHEIEGHHPALLIADAMEQSGSDDPVSRAQYADIKTYLAGDILTKVDRTSMAASLEVRVPMLDHPFLDWAGTLPSGLKLHNGTGKYILKRALEPFVPQGNLYRGKRGFATSLAPYFRGRAGEQVRAALLDETMADCGLFDLKAVARLADSHLAGGFDRSQEIWSLLMFQGFLRKVHFRSQDRDAAASQPNLLPA